jgi:hypothetical protein
MEQAARLAGELEGAEKYIRVLQQEKVELAAKHEHLRGLHSEQVRVCSVTVDPIALTARLRAIEPTLRVEWDGDRMVIYSQSSLTEAEYNAVVAAAIPDFDRT